MGDERNVRRRRRSVLASSLAVVCALLIDGGVASPAPAPPVSARRVPVVGPQGWAVRGWVGEMVRSGDRLLATVGTQLLGGGERLLVSDDGGDSWDVSRPEALRPLARGGFRPRQFGRFDNPHLFSSGGTVVLSGFLGGDPEPASDGGPPYTVISLDHGDSWRPLELATPGGQWAYPQELVTVGDRLFLVGSVGRPDIPWSAGFALHEEGHYDQHDTAVWVSDDDGATWRRIISRAFARRTGNQEARALLADGDRLVLGGIDTGTDPSYRTGCCWFTPDPVIYLSDDLGETWRKVRSPNYTGDPDDVWIDSFRLDGGRLRADYGRGALRTDTTVGLVSDDRGETWSPVPGRSSIPSPGSILRIGRRAVAVGLGDCTDCELAVASVSEDAGGTWRDVPLRFPCQDTTSRGHTALDGPPARLGGTLVALGQCNDGSAYPGVIATSGDLGSSWTVRRPAVLRPTDPEGSVEAVASARIRGRLVALTEDQDVDPSARGAGGLPPLVRGLVVAPR